MAKKKKKSLSEMLRGRGRQIDDIVDSAVGKGKKKSLASAIVGPVAGTLVKGLMARRNARTPLLMDCLTVVAQLRRGQDLTIHDFFLEAEMLSDLLREVDDDKEVKQILDSIQEDYGGEQ
jgi:hypothetical protein